MVLEAFLLGAEVPADQRAHPEHLEEVPGDRGHGEHLRALAEPHGQGLLVVGGDPGEDVRALAELQQPGPGVAEGALPGRAGPGPRTRRPGPGSGRVRISAASSTV